MSSCAPTHGKWTFPGSSTSLAPAIRSAVSLICSIPKSRSPVLPITSVGTWIERSACVALISRFIRSSATAAPGLADLRMYEASQATSCSSVS